MVFVKCYYKIVHDQAQSEVRNFQIGKSFQLTPSLPVKNDTVSCIRCVVLEIG